VFAPWRHLIQELSKIFTGHGIDHAVIHGEIGHREQIFNAFQNTTQYDVLLAHPETVHHGITLTTATTVLWYSPVVSLEVYEQANARIRRVGQKHKQQFLHFISTPIERHVYRMLKNKQRLQTAFLALVEEATKT
jgi:SNF2 family DNA or RNA helicase